ncbi:MAG: T9SS type A sorting domain-containing protein [Flavobacteriales bacterium]|nr:T9SS type A sorting domain-containing protein [Flavobacteriales bacterium]
MKRHILSSITILTTGLASACSCFGPTTFCESTDTSWAEPDLIVLGVKVDEVHYGMRVKVLEVLSGDAIAGDTLVVWGDNGALCRWYVGAWAIGDTVLWAFHDTDFMGNFITAGYPPDLEQEGHFHISICGWYWLNYSSGTVSGNIAPGLNTLPLSDMLQYTNGCIGTVIEGPEGDRPLSIWPNPASERVWVDLETGGEYTAEVHDGLGRIIIRERISSVSGSFSIDVSALPVGTYHLHVLDRDRRRTASFQVVD